MKVNKKQVMTSSYVLELTEDETFTLCDALTYAIDELENNPEHRYDFNVENDIKLLGAIIEELTH